MANFVRIAQTISDAANAWLPDGYVFGYSLPHDVPIRADDPEYATATEDIAHLDLHSAIRLREYRQSAIAYGQKHAGTVTASDVTALPSAGRYLIAEIIHRPTGIAAFRAYSYDTIRDIATDDTRTLAQKRTAVRNALQSLFTDCQTRVQASDWVP